MRDNTRCFGQTIDRISSNSLYYNHNYDRVQRKYMPYSLVLKRCFIDNYYDDCFQTENV